MSLRFSILALAPASGGRWGEEVGAWPGGLGTHWRSDSVSRRTKDGVVRVCVEGGFPTPLWGAMLGECRRQRACPWGAGWEGRDGLG